MEVLLISIQSSLDAIGLKYIHSMLPHNSTDSNILFIPSLEKKGESALINFLLVSNPRIVGISLMSCHFSLAKKLSILIRQTLKDTIIIWGGIYPTVNPKICLDYCDYVFRGESELQFLKFVTAIRNRTAVTNIENLVYISNGKVITNQLGKFGESLDSLPFPEHFPRKSYILHEKKVYRLNRWLFKKYSRGSGAYLSIITTRGCNFSCSYCCNSFFSKLYGQQQIRRRSVQNVVEEIKLALRKNPEIVYIDIVDDNFFSYNLEWIEQFCKSYKKIRKELTCRATPTNVDEKKLLLLKNSGLGWVFMGLQSGSPRILNKIYNRHVSGETFIKAAKLVKKFRLAGYYDVITDNPYETEDDTLQTIEVILKIPKPYMLQLLSLCFYEGTDLYYRAKNDNLLIEDSFAKNIHRFKPTYLNRLIRLCPMLPASWIKLFVQNRKSRWARGLLNLVYVPAILLIEPITWFRLVLISYNYDFIKTIKTSFFFLKTGITQMLNRI